MPDSKRGQSDSIRSLTKEVVAEVLPSLEGDKGADEPESTCILAFFEVAQTASGNKGGEWVGQGAQPLVEGVPSMPVWGWGQRTCYNPLGDQACERGHTDVSLGDWALAALGACPSVQ